jgi:lipoprotein-releasing system permease protein
MFELFVALRYLRAKRKQAVFSLITGISILGVAAGVMALVIAVAVQTGMRNTLERNLLSATAAVRIEEREPLDGIDGWEAISHKLAGLAHVRSAAPALYEFGLLGNGVTAEPVRIKGISVEASVPIPEALAHMHGSFDALRHGPTDRPPIIVGAGLAKKIGASLEKPRINLLNPTGRITPNGVEPSVEPLQLVGTFESGFYDIDAGFAFMSLRDTQAVFQLDDVVNAIELNLDDRNRAPEVADAAAAVIGPKLTAISWEQDNATLVSAFELDRMVALLVTGMIQLVAALMILVVLTMMVMEKNRDIAVLMSMGARVQQIRRIFILEGALIGGAGTTLGLILGYTLCFFADRYRWLHVDAQIYGLSYIPFESHWIDGLWIAATAMAVSLLATLHPARSATRIAPVEALRYE